MDLNDLAVAPDVISDMELTHPGTGAVLRDKDGKAFFIGFRSPTSERAILTKRANLDRRMRQRTQVKAEQLEDEQLELLIACAARWYLPPLGGEALEFSEAAARKLFTDERFPWIRMDADRFLGDISHFTKTSSSS